MQLPNRIVEQSVDKKDYQTLSFKLDDGLINKYIEKKYYLKTYGCQMNEHDSENIKALLENMGFLETSLYQDADLVLFNTCSIRENAHNKAFGMLGRIKHLKEEKPNIIVGICGCMAQEESVCNRILDKYKWINFVIGTHNINELPNIIDRSILNNSLNIEVLSREGDLYENIPVKRENPYKAYVNIIYGCDKFCTYCIVPYTRGRQRSRRREDILLEIKDLIKNNYQEVTLLGQNVNAYGKDLYDDYDMANLLEDVALLNIPRIRFVTSHPWDFTDKMINIIAKYDNIMPSIHLPIQSGSNRILKLMGRRYTKESYLELFTKLKNKVKNCVISTDIIVGFPTETAEDFNETLDVVNKCQYDNAFTFIFSKREGTPATKIIDETTLCVKEDRLRKLNDVVNKYFLLNNQKLIGKKVKVLVDNVSNKKNHYCGYTDTNKLVNFSSKNNCVGKIVEVMITDAKTWSLDGRICE